MGGKNKQRTKGNVRPSSSGRAAELLARERGAVPGFVGFGTTASNDLGYVPAVFGAEEIDNLVDADFRMVLRKLSKRDTVTKLKAVQEFGSMCQEREAEIVKGVLPYWPRIYCKISVDHDRRVREATQQSFQQLILKVRRNLAPYLKSIMGYWLIAQCDTYSPAASAANQAFEAAFPISKQPEALGFCKEEVLNILQDNLLKETPETLSDPQSVPLEEREAKYTRLLTSSLLAVKKLLATLSQQDLDSLSERLAYLIAQSKFWKYSKHKIPQIRGAFFEAVATLCERTPQLVQKEAGRACPTVLLSIEDTDPVVLPPLWEAVLHVISSIPDCWTHVNARKGVLPKLWGLLREGGRGLATVLHPNLLPFISKLPQEVTDPKMEFYNTFFTAVIQGLRSERALASPSESAAVVFAAVECLRYALLQNAGEDESGRQIQSALVTEQLLPLVESALGSPALQGGPLFPQLTDMLVSWEKRAESADQAAAFRRLLEDFWEGLRRLCVRRVDREEEEGAESGELVGVASLLRVMQNPAGGEVGSGLKKKKKKTVKICFPDQEGPEGKEGEEPKREEGRGQGEAPPLKSGHLEALVCRLAALAMARVSRHDSEPHLRFLSVLVSSFPSRQLFQALLDPAGEEEEQEEQKWEEELKGAGEQGGEELAQNPAVRFLLRKVVVWLRQDRYGHPDFLVNMVFSALHCCRTTEGKTVILNHITRMDLKWGVVLQIIQKACADPVCLEASIGWLKGAVLGERLVGLAGELCELGLGSTRSTKATPTADHTHSWALISLALSQHHLNERLIGEEYVEKIIDKLHATLSEAKDLSDAGNMEPLVSFICEVASSFFSSLKGCLLLASAEELLLTVFQLCAQDQESTRLSDSLLQKLRQACFAGVHSLLSQPEAELREGAFLHSAAVWVKKQLLSAPFGVRSLQALMSAVHTLVETLLSCSSQGGVQLLPAFISCLTPSAAEWKRIRHALPPQWVKSPLLSGRLRVTRAYPCIDVWKFRCSSKLPAHLSASALLGKVLLAAMEAPGHQGAGSPKLPDLKHTVSEVLFAMQWCEEVMEFSPAVVTDYLRMLQELNLTADRISKQAEHRCDVLETLFAQSLEEGSLWTLTLASYIRMRGVVSVKKLYGSVESFFPLTEHRLCTIQVLCPSLSREERESLVALSISELLNWQDTDPNNGFSGMACLAVLHCCLETETPVEEEVLLAVVATMMEWRNVKEELFLFSSDLKTASAGALSLNVEMMRFLSRLMVHSPAMLRDTHWDFLLCSMLAWLEAASENTGAFWNPWVQLFVSQNCGLIVTLSEFFSAPPAGVADQLPPNLRNEWEEFFVEGMHSLLLPLLVKITEEYREPDDALFPQAVLGAVGEALQWVPVQLLTQNKLPPKFVAGQKTNLPEPLQTLLNTLTPLLLFKARPVQLTAFHVLSKVMPQLPECDSESDSGKCEDDDGEEPCLSPPAALMSVLATAEELLDNILGGVPVGEYAVVQPLSDEHCCILGYLLAWKLILTFFKASPSHLRVQYSLFLRKSRSLHTLLLHLFRLMPENPSLPGQVAEPGAKDPKTFFTEDLCLSVRKRDGMQWELPHLACWVYYSALKDLPAMVRLWWNGQDKRIFNTVDKFTSKYVSGVLSAQEISSVHSSTQTFHSMTVKARSATREVIATYSVDDIFIELVIQLPQNYPLGSISVESGRRVGVAVQQWRNWMLQLSTYLTHQNGSIMEGLSLWKNNVDKRFEGVEDCMICFSVIHGSNYSLPKKACRTCKKKFHSACLYKWFTSSNKSTCPLCRETFF
ncbi:E3 ubiquitin-protein ligase listerin isoform X1 [Anguilla rostrata]|uniref:E3 ubiquitin-protein ligase listerin isoform X1 n=1 Tax=Anguilla rostrata TaxID=7938 RepID=UPI0030D17B16